VAVVAANDRIITNENIVNNFNDITYTYMLSETVCLILRREQGITVPKCITSAQSTPVEVGCFSQLSQFPCLTPFLRKPLSYEVSRRR
jgi:hypothetical protein